MIASGLPKRNGKKHIQEVADCALDILASVSTFCIPHQPEKKVRIRIGKFTNFVMFRLRIFCIYVQNARLKEL